MRPDPKPLDHFAFHHRKGTKIISHASGPKSSDSLEVERRMSRIIQPQFEVFARQPTNLCRQSSQRLTKTWGRRGLHRAAPWFDRHPLWLNAHTKRRADHFANLLRSADPSPSFRALSVVAATSETRSAGVSQWPLRSLPVCSLVKGRINLRPKARNQRTIHNSSKGAAPFRARVCELISQMQRRFTSFNGATSRGPLTFPRNRSLRRWI